MERKEIYVASEPVKKSFGDGSKFIMKFKSGEIGDNLEYGCFKSELFSLIVAGTGIIADVETKTSTNPNYPDNYNIVNIYQDGKPVIAPKAALKSEPKQFKADPEKQASIELQHYTDNVKDLWIAGKLQNDSPLVKKYLSILYSKVGATVDLPKAKPEAPQSTTAPSNSISRSKPQVTKAEVKKALDKVEPKVAGQEKTYNMKRQLDIIKEAINRKIKDWDIDTIKTDLAGRGGTGTLVSGMLATLSPEQFELYDKKVKALEKQLNDDNPPMDKLMEKQNKLKLTKEKYG